MKAVLLSALIFPGVGHLFLKKYFSAVILFGTSLFALYFLLATLMGRALQIADKIQSGEARLDAMTIAELVASQPAGTESRLFDIASAVLIVAWVIGIADSYRIAHGQDKDRAK